LGVAVEVVPVASKNTDSGAIPDVRIANCDETTERLELPVKLIRVVEPDPPQEAKLRVARNTAKNLREIIFKLNKWKSDMAVSLEESVAQNLISKPHF